MRQIVVLPTMSLGARGLPCERAVVRAIEDIAPARILVTGVAADAACVGCSPAPCTACLSDEELYKRYRDFVGKILTVGSRPSLGFVGLGADALPGCTCRSCSRIWLENDDVEALPAAHELTPGWCVLGRSVQMCRNTGAAPGQTAVTLARRRKVSVIVGDTGRLGVGRLKVVGDGTELVLTGLEVGSLMLRGEAVKVDRRRTSELGFGVVTLDGGSVVNIRGMTVWK